MSRKHNKDQSDLVNTLFITLYLRAIESKRPNALVKDEWAEEIVRQLDQDFLERTLALTEESGRIVMILKSRDFDQLTQAYLADNSNAVVVHLGCGLDTRFERVDNGRVEWYDLDLPEVIDLRHKYIGNEGERHHDLACSVLEREWIDELQIHSRRPFLFLAEGLFMYLNEDQVKSVVLAIKQNFPGAELVFDAYSPFMRWAHNFKVLRTRVGSRLNWSLKYAKNLERWGSGIRLLEERYPFSYPEPRLRSLLKIRAIHALAKGIGVFRFQL